MVYIHENERVFGQCNMNSVDNGSFTLRLRLNLKLPNLGKIWHVSETADSMVYGSDRVLRRLSQVLGWLQWCRVLAPAMAPSLSPRFGRQISWFIRDDALMCPLTLLF